MISCSDTLTPDRSGIVAISADINSLEVDVKSAVPFEAFPLNARVMCSFTPGIYLNAPKEPWYIPCHTDVTFESRDLTFIKYKTSQTEIKNLTYPTQADATQSDKDEITENIYCVGMYPNSEWKISNNGKSASHPINGTEDLMFADQIEGTWNRPFPTQQYTHLQTWITILVSANTIGSAAQWGKIKEVTIESSDSVKISFPTASTGKSSITYSGIKEIEVYSDSEGKDLSITTQEIGSVFMVPVILDDNNVSLTVTVKTSTFPEGKTVREIRLLDEKTNKPIQKISDIIGKVFVINLNFNPLSIIEGVCTLHYWHDQDKDLYLQ